MRRVVEAIIEADGTVRVLERVDPGRVRRALLTIVDEPGEEVLNETAALSEEALSDWERGEEDEAWSHLQREP